MSAPCRTGRTVRGQRVNALALPRSAKGARTSGYERSNRRRGRGRWSVCRSSDVVHHLPVVELATEPSAIEAIGEAVERANHHLSGVEQIKRFHILEPVIRRRGMSQVCGAADRLVGSGRLGGSSVRWDRR